MTSSSFKFRTLGLTMMAGLVLMGQSCSINLGSSGTADGGVFRSDDHGQTWQQRVFVNQQKNKVVTLNQVTVRTFVFEPDHHQHIYIGTRENGIWQSTDGGDHWQSTSLRTGDYPCIDFDPENHSIMYTVAGATVLKSTDAGATWTVIYTESQPGHLVTCVVVDPLNGRLVWTTTSGGKILQSDDYGQTWTLQSALTPFEPRLVHVDGDGSGRMEIFSRNSGIFTSDNHGATWVDMSASLKDYPNALDIRSVVVHPSGWYLGTAYGLLRSTDRGATWTSLHTLVTVGSIPIQNVAINPRTSQELFITVGQKIHHTTDGGTSWSVRPAPTSRTPVFLTFDPTLPDRLYISAFKPTKK